MQRSVFGPAARLAGFMFLAVSLLTGCSDKVTPLTPGDNAGASSDIVLFGVQDQIVTSTAWSDPGTPQDPTDDTFIGASSLTFGGDTTSAILQVLDASEANTVRPYRREGASQFTRFLDFDVPAFDRNLRTNTDLYLLRDSRGILGASEYLAKGIVNGLETRSSPVSNQVFPWGHVENSLILSIDRLQRDSVMAISFTPDPRAVVYVLEGYFSSVITTSRDLGALSSLPLPIAMTHQFSSFGFVLPGEETQIRIPFYRVPFQKNLFPLQFVMRMSAIDANGRVVARSAPDFIQRPLGRDEANNNLYELDPVGGWIITLDPYPRGYGRPQASVQAAPPVTYDHATVQAMLGGRTPGSFPSSVVTYESLMPALQQAAQSYEAAGGRPVTLPGVLPTLPKGLFKHSTN
jgi:hypothetical protein